MNTYQVEASKVIQGRPDDVYASIADYHRDHPAILPSRYFSDMTVVEGGRGEGTVIEVQMNVFGAKALLHMQVSEPEPGRVLVEEDRTAGVVTTFTVDPVNGGHQSQVTIATRARTSPGLRGFFEKLMNPPITRRIYREELDQLNEIVRDRR